MSPSKENARKAQQVLEDQMAFMSGESVDFLQRFLVAAERRLPSEEKLEKERVQSKQRHSKRKDRKYHAGDEGVDSKSTRVIE